MPPQNKDTLDRDVEKRANHWHTHTPRTFFEFRHPKGKQCPPQGSPKFPQVPPEGPPSVWWKPTWQTQGKCWEKSVWQAKARARGEQRQGESKSKRQKGKGQKAEEKGQGRARAACQKLWKALHGICFYCLRSWERSGVEKQTSGRAGPRPKARPRQGQGQGHAQVVKGS